MKVLFVFFTDPPRPFSSSVAALAAVVRAAGHEPSALEVSVKGSVADAARRISESAADVVAVSAMTRDWPGASAVISRMEGSAFVVVGGYHATFAPHDVAGCERVDAICVGEGERPLAALLTALAVERAPQRIAGLWTRTSGVFSGPVPAACPEPDIGRLLPWDYDVFGDVRKNLRAGINTFGPHVDGYLPTRASRGCPFRCTYCSAPAWGNVGGYANKAMNHVRSVGHLCDELSALKERYAPEGFEFWDEHFPLSVPWLMELAETYPRRVGLPFKVEMHPSAARKERLELLARAGCVLFHCGVEAGDETLRRETLGRRTPDRELEEVFENCRRLGLKTSASLMTMLPGETRSQTLSTTALLRRLRPDSFMWSTYQPLPGTPLGDAAVRAWPAPASARLDDHPPYATSTPPHMTETERDATFRELASLQSELVSEATRRDAPAARPRPIDVPVPKELAPTALARLLGLSVGLSVDLPESLPQEPRLVAASWQGAALTLLIEGPLLPASQITIAPNDGARFYRTTPLFGLSYRGREAPPALLAVLDAIAARLSGVELAELKRALPVGAPA